MSDCERVRAIQVHTPPFLKPNLSWYILPKTMKGNITLAIWSLACEQAHLVCYSREYFGGGSRRAKRAGEKNGARKSEPARKPLNFEFRPCEVTSLNCQVIKYLTNTSKAKCKQARQQIFTLERIEFLMNVLRLN